MKVWISINTMQTRLYNLNRLMNFWYGVDQKKYLKVKQFRDELKEKEGLK